MSLAGGVVMRLVLLPFLALGVAGQAPASTPAPSRCYSAYYPAGMGTEWEYRGETRISDRRGQGSITRSESRQRVVALAADSMRLQSAWTYTDVTSGRVSPSSNTLEYTCGDDGPVMVGDVSSGHRTVYRGSIAPRRSDAGTKWDYTTEMVDAQDGRGIRTVRRHEVVGTESVVVPAGQFEALKVAWEQEMVRIDPDPKELQKWQKIDRDMRTTMKGFEWYAPHVGLVRRSFETTSIFKGKQESRSEGADELVTFRP